jgi:monoterpene epsilon-lactone hydrolase
MTEDPQADEQLGTVLPLPPAPDGIELRHLRAFVAVAEELNFGRAASRLYLSQPALSRQIRTLERLVGCDLLRRSTHRVELTLGGEALLDRARRLLHHVDDAVAATRSVGGELAERMARLWEPITDLTTADVDLQTLRNANEDLHAQFAVPEVDVRPVNAAGVPSLVLTPRADRADQPGSSSRSDRSNRSGQPDGSAPPVTLLFLHGGGYVMGSAFGYRHLAGALALAAETGALMPEYRLAPEHPFPAALEDAMRAYLWMLDGGTDPKQVVVVGDSCGGGLVLSLLLTLRQQDVALPGGVALLCPGVDLSFDHLERAQASEPQPAVSVAQVRDFAAAYLAGHPADDPVVAPLRADLTGLPPMLIQAGTGDTFVDDAHRLADRAREHGVDVTLALYPVPTHDFHIFWSFLPEAADALHQAGRFVQDIRSGAARSQRSLGS